MKWSGNVSQVETEVRTEFWLETLKEHAAEKKSSIILQWILRK